MLSGDLAAGGLVEVLVQLAEGRATGCVHMRSPAGETAEVYLRHGTVYAVVPGELADLLGWPVGSWRLQLNERTWAATERDLLAELDLPPLDALPALSAGEATGPELALDTDAWLLLSRVDGGRSVRRLADEGGLTAYAGACVVRRLLHAGMLELRDAPAVAAAPARETPGFAGLEQVQRSVGQVVAALEGVFGPARELSDAFARPVVAPQREVVPAAEALAAFSFELSATASSAPSEAPVQPEPEPDPVDAPDPEPADEPAPAEDADMASLLRELSSLGVDEEPATAVRAPAAYAGAPQPSRQRKKGLFGR